MLTIRGARQNNLKNIDASFPLGLFICVTGVSGSGKSSLVGDILREALARDLNGAIAEPGEHDGIDGLDQLDKVIDIDQSPIGRTPRSNPSTYTKLFDQIRDLYAQVPEAKARGYAPGRFSFNVAGGRCEACEGNGSNKLEMDFLADVWVTCPVCQGKRFGRETLHVRFKGKSISDVLDMDVQEALDHFANLPKIAGMLQTLCAMNLATASQLRLIGQMRIRASGCDYIAPRTRIPALVSSFHAFHGCTCSCNDEPKNDPNIVCPSIYVIVSPLLPAGTFSHVTVAADRADCAVWEAQRSTIDASPCTAATQWIALRAQHTLTALQRNVAFFIRFIATQQ